MCSSDLLTASVTVNNPSSVSKVVFYSLGISSMPDGQNTLISAFNQTTITSSSNVFQAAIPANTITDPIGLAYDFRVFAATDTVWANPNDRNLAYKKISGGAVPNLTGLSFGSQVSNYQIVSIPLNLTNKNVTSVFSALGNYVKSSWRLFDYSSGNNREYPAFNKIGRAHV